MNEVLISVIIPTYNRSKIITKTLSSFLNQLDSNFEVIIVDDGSTDNTLEIVTNFIFTNRLNNFFYYKKENKERAAARNYGAMMSKGKYLNFFDSDDLALNNHISVASKMIGKEDVPLIFHLNYAFFNPFNNKIKKNNLKFNNINKDIVYGNLLSCNGVFIKKDIFMYDFFNENRNLSASEDWELWLRLASKYKIIGSNIITSYIVNHNQRSVNLFDLTALNSRKTELILSLEKNKKFLQKYPNGIKYIKYQMNSYISLHACVFNKKKIALKYLIYSLTDCFFCFFSKRTLIIVYKLFIN